MTERHREHRLVFISDGFHTPIDTAFSLESGHFSAALKTSGSELTLQLACPAPDNYDQTHLRQVEEEAYRIASLLRSRLHLVLTDMGGDCDLSQIECVGRHHPPVPGPDAQLFATGFVVTATVGAPRLVGHLTADQMVRLATLVAPLAPISVGEQFFLDAERVADPMAKLVLLWSGLSILFGTEDHGEIDKRLRAVDPLLPLVSVLRPKKAKGKTLVVTVTKSVVRAARDQIAHLGERDPSGLEVARRDAGIEAVRLRRLFVRVLAQVANSTNQSP